LRARGAKPRLAPLRAIIDHQTAAAEAQLGAFGMMVVTDRAIVAGAASIPGPFPWQLELPLLVFSLVASRALSVAIDHSINCGFRKGVSSV